MQPQHGELGECDGQRTHVRWVECRRVPDQPPTRTVDSGFLRFTEASPNVRANAALRNTFKVEALRRRRCPVMAAGDDGFTQRREGLAVGPRSEDRHDGVAQPAR
jgi:hypothetical protein